MVAWSDEELLATLQHLQRSNSANDQYQSWTSSVPSIPVAYRSLEGINLRDEIHCSAVIFPHLKFLKSVIDYFLASLVFPKEVKEFPFKLSASGWDIGAVKRQPMTGFSGTNDSRHLLPLDATQVDIESQSHTNALVLEHLLNPDNFVASMSGLNRQSVSKGRDFIQSVSQMRPPIRVILDVGAQIIDLNNQQVAATWLEILEPGSAIEAAVFCDENDQLSVLDRAGNVESLLVSPFRNRLDSCLVFLDEAHTRGIDLPLPSHYRAAVTLGAGLTKDRLVQGNFSCSHLPHSY